MLFKTITERCLHLIGFVTQNKIYRLTQLKHLLCNSDNNLETFFPVGRIDSCPYSMYSRCKFINGCLAASIVCIYYITIVLSRNSAGGPCHCITFSDSGRVPGMTEEDPRVQAQSGTKTHSGLLSKSGTKNMPLEVNQ